MTDILRTTVEEIQRKKTSGEKIVAITAYDYTSARIADSADTDIILVGDSLGMVMLGYENTLPVTMDEMIHHTRAVARGAKRALIVGDMPYLSFHISSKETVKNAGRFIKEGGAHAVKIEGGKKRVKTIKAILDAEIPVMGHIGLTPQSIHKFGGYKVQGKTSERAKQLIKDAKALEKAGVFSVVLEGIPLDLAKEITRSINIPTIGIGAGPYCDGQILVFHDALGLFTEVAPKFVRKYFDGFSVMRDALNNYAKDIKEGGFPSFDESYHALREIKKFKRGK